MVIRVPRPPAGCACLRRGVLAAGVRACVSVGLCALSRGRRLPSLLLLSPASPPARGASSMSQVFPGSHGGRGGGDGDGDDARADAEVINERPRGSSSSSSASASSASGRCSRFLVALRPRLLPHSRSPRGGCECAGRLERTCGRAFLLCVCAWVCIVCVSGGPWWCRPCARRSRASCSDLLPPSDTCATPRDWGPGVTVGHVTSMGA